jgi:hypothetical protein
MTYRLASLRRLVVGASSMTRGSFELSVACLKSGF